MDWSDDVSYCVHDLEDALVAGQVSVTDFSEDLPLLHEVMVRDYDVDATETEARAALGRLQKLSCWPSYYDGTHKGLARIKVLECPQSMLTVDHFKRENGIRFP